MTGQGERYSRRQLLGGAGGTLVAGFAGCIGTGTSAGSNTSGGTKTADGATPARRTQSAAREKSNSGSLPPVNVGDGTTGFDLSVDGNAIVGRTGASVDLYYWGDYQCPFCKRFEEGAFPKLLDDEVANGTLRIVPLAFPNIGEASWNAAVMSRCVWKDVRDTHPTAFLEWHRKVFDAQRKPNSGWASPTRLFSIAKSVEGVDASAVRSCYSGENADELDGIRAERRRAREAGIDVTPGFVAYGRETERSKKLVGAQPYEQFANAVEVVTE